MKKYLVFALAVLVIGALVTGVLAAGKTGGAGKSNIAHLYLYEKDPDTWDIVPGGAWGKMKYNLSGPTFDYVFNGHRLEPNTDYSLIYYIEPQTTWPTPVEVIDSGTSNGGGNIHLGGSHDFGHDLEIVYRALGHNSSKIWLVLTGDLSADQTQLVGWNPTEYLFEYDLISYDDTDA